MNTVLNAACLTERLVIRPYRNSDFPIWHKDYSGCLPARNQYDEGMIDMNFYTQEWFEEMVIKHQELMAKDETYIFGVFRKVDHAHVGVIDFSTLIRNEFQWGRVGYTILNTYWGNGYGREAVRAALDMAFSQLEYHRIEAHINLDNGASIKLAESVGMDFECVRKAFVYEFGEWKDHRIYYKNGK